MSTKVKKVEKPPDETPLTSSEDMRAHPLLALREEVDTLFDRFFSNFTLGPFGRHGPDLEPLRRLESGFTRFTKMAPYADFSETDKAVKISVDLPGMEEEDIDISLNDEMLTIKGEKSEEKTEEGENFHMMERSHGSVKRMFRIPPTAIADKAVATFKNGVLNIEIPKKAEKEKEKVRKIEIKN